MSKTIYVAHIYGSRGQLYIGLRSDDHGTFKNKRKFRAYVRKFYRNIVSDMYRCKRRIRVAISTHLISRVNGVMPHVQMLGRAERPQIVPQPTKKAVKVELSKKFLTAVKAPDYDGYVRRLELAAWIRAAQHQLESASDSKREYLNAGIAKLKAAFKD